MPSIECDTSIHRISCRVLWMCPNFTKPQRICKTRAASPKHEPRKALAPSHVLFTAKVMVASELLTHLTTGWGIAPRSLLEWGYVPGIAWEACRPYGPMAVTGHIWSWSFPSRTPQIIHIFMGAFYYESAVFRVPPLGGNFEKWGFEFQSKQQVHKIPQVFLSAG